MSPEAAERKPVEKWARPTKPRVPPPAPDPSEDPAWGDLPEPCRDCRGVRAHEALCPTLVEQEARRWSNPKLIAVAISARGDQGFDPVQYFNAWADELIRAEPPHSWLLDPPSWSHHYKAVASRIAELMPDRKVPDRKTKTFADLLASPNRDVFKAKPQPKRLIQRTKHHGPKLFDDPQDGLGDEE